MGLLGLKDKPMANLLATKDRKIQKIIPKYLPQDLNS
jgi:hypothetical protein